MPVRSSRSAVSSSSPTSSRTRSVTCSYFEQVQGHANYYWDRADVLSKVDSRMRTAFADVYDRAEREQVPVREAAYLIAVERVAHACRERGWV